MIGSLRAVLKIILMIVWTLPLVATQCIVLMFHKGPGSYYVPQLWHNGIAFIIGLKTEVRGEKFSSAQTIFVGNHLSYLDIFCLGSILRASFVAKEDIAHWPVIGFLSKVQQTAFISRSSDQAKKVANSLATMLAAGKGLILFPEGTSTHGRTVLPFKSSLFSLVRDETTGKALLVQPFTISILETDDKPLDDTSTASRDLYAWYGDMDFGPHFWKFLTCKGAKIQITIHPVLQPQPDQDRKILAKTTWNTVCSVLPPESAGNA
jgi:1-acyl-sn-glycerol-3-phosphate acyltransferase